MFESICSLSLRITIIAYKTIFLLFTNLFPFCMYVLEGTPQCLMIQGCHASVDWGARNLIESSVWSQGSSDTSWQPVGLPTGQLDGPLASSLDALQSCTMDFQLGPDVLGALQRQRAGWGWRMRFPSFLCTLHFTFTSILKCARCCPSLKPF